MHTPGSASGGGAAPAPRTEAILAWLQSEMSYPGPLPSPDALRKVLRGNMLPVFSFPLSRVRSDRTTSTARRNFRLLSAPHRLDPSSLRDRHEADRLRTLARRQRQDLRARMGRMADLAREESDRAKSLHDRSNSRHKQVMLEAFDRQCDEAARIFTEYQRRIHHYILQARDVPQAAAETETEAVYSTVRGNRLTGDIVVVETSRERSVRRSQITLSRRSGAIFRRTTGAGLA